MTRLPRPGSDDNVWGDLLNEFLSVTHNADGSLKSNAVTSTIISDGSISTSKLANNAVTLPKLQATNSPNAGQVLTTSGTDLSWQTPSTGVTDHGNLAGLGDDDHPQYHTDTRGDARYYTQAQVDAMMAGVVRAIRYTGSAWPDRSTVTSDPAVTVMWVGGTISPSTMVDGDVWVRS